MKITSLSDIAKLELRLRNHITDTLAPLVVTHKLDMMDYDMVVDLQESVSSFGFDIVVSWKEYWNTSGDDMTYVELRKHYDSPSIGFDYDIEQEGKYFIDEFIKEELSRDPMERVLEYNPHHGRH